MDYVIHVVIIALIFVILAVSLNLLIGYTGLVSMAHAAFFGVGAYTTAIVALQFGVNLLLAMVVGILLSAIMGIVIAVPALRTKNEYFILLTLGFQMVIYGLMVNLVGVTGGRGGLVGIPRPSIFGLDFLSPASYLPLVFILAVLSFAICWRIAHSPFGRVLKGIREDETATRSLGKDIVRFKILVFMVSGGIAAVAGGIFSGYVTFINPFSFSLHEGIFIIALVVLGGSANLWGSVLGAFLLIGIPEALRFLQVGTEIIDPLRVAIYGVLLIIFMRFRPQGLIPEYVRAFTKGPRPVEPLPQGAKSAARQAKLGQYQSRAEATPQIILEAIEINKSFGGLRAVDGLSFSMESGKITSLVGPNGCGKTTAFNLITGFLVPDGGKIYFRGQDITKLPPHRLAQMGIARSWQDVRIFPGMTVLDNVLMARQNQRGESLIWLFLSPWRVAQQEEENCRQAMEYLGFVGLTDKAMEMAGSLSFAEQKLLGLARLLATEAEVLLLDEPAAGVDPAWVDQIMALIHRLADSGKTICIVEHNLDVVRGVADTVYFLQEGKQIAKGTATALMADPKLAEIYFGA